MPKGKRTKEKDLPKVFDTPLFPYLRKDNASHAKKHGKKLFGSYSGYIDALISKDRGVDPVLGTWKAEGESKALREEKKPVVENAGVFAATPPRAEPPKEERKPEKFTPGAGPGSPGYRDPVV